MTAFFGTNGTWTTTTSNGPTSAAPADWTQLTWTTPAAPAGATHLSFGVTLQSVGSLTVDDLAISGTPPSDATPPSVSLTAPTADSTVRGSVTISASATDDRGVAEVQFLVDDAVVGSDTTAPYSTSWNSATVADGTHAITARATDTAGNPATSAPRGVAVDNSGPLVALTAPSDGAAVAGDVPLTASATDASSVTSVEFLVDDTVVATDTSAPYGATWDSTTVADGAHAITARATDGPGNVATSAAADVTVGNVVSDLPPEVALTAPAASSTLSGTVTLSANASDDVGIARVEFLAGTTVVGTDTSAPYSTTWDTTGVADGSVSLTARATDSADQVTTSAAVAATVDNHGPSVAITAPAVGASVSGSATLSATASDTSGVAKVEFLVDGVVVGSDTSAPFGIAWDTTGTPDGSVSIAARATDVLDQATTSAARTVSVDNAAPVVAISSPADGAVVAGPVNIFATVTDASAVTVEFLVDGTVVNTDSTPPSYDTTWDSTTVPDGPVTIAARATDAAGNVATSASETLTVANHVDTAPPAVSLTAPASGVTVGGSSVTVSATASDDKGVDHVDFRVGTNLVGTDTSSPYTISWDTTNLPDGAATLTAVAVDTSGNETTSAARTVTVDNTGPAVTLTAPADGATVSGNRIALSATATDPAGIASVAFVIDGTVVGTDTSSPYSINWNSKNTPDGPKALTARATDRAGNVATSLARTITVRNGPAPDTTPPTVSLNAPAAGATVAGTSVTLSASASDNVGVSRVEFLVDGTVVGSDTSSPYSISWNSTAVANGQVSIAARAVDAAANAGTSAPRTITVSNQPPAVMNASLEAATGSTPDCWQSSSSGKNTSAFARLADAHTGSFAERITVSGYKNGNARFLSGQDATCGIAGIPGRAYRLGLWLKGTGSAIRIAVSYRNSSGSWVSWTTSGTAAASAAWAERTFTTPALPSGATLLSFGVSVEGNAVITVDDFSISLAP
jgi:hypothetical protein